VRRLLRLAVNDVRLTARDRAAALWLLVMPVFLIWLFGSAFGGPRGDRRVALTILDRDGGWLAAALASELDPSAVKLDVRRGPDASPRPPPGAVRWIEIPAGFTEGALAGTQQTLAVEAAKDASAEGTRGAEVVLARAILRTLARAAEMKQSGATLSAAAYERLRARPALVSLEVATAGKGATVPSGVAQSLPGTLTFTVLMMTTIYGAVFLTIEKREGMLRRQLTLPLSRGAIVGGKILGRAFIALLQIALLIAVGKLAFKLDFGASPLGLATLLGAYTFAVAGFATLAGAVLANPEQASIVGWLASMVMAALGGCWWPSEVMPGWLRSASHVFPTSWAMDGLHSLISFGRGFEAVVLPSAVLVGFGALFSLAAAARLRA